MTKKILIIDDSRIARQQVINALRGHDFEVVEAINGSDGLAKMTSDSELRVVICDVNMPVMNGLELLTELHTRASAIPPFLMLTSEAQPELIAEAKRHGATAWMMKPFKPDLLVAAVRKLAE